MCLNYVGHIKKSQCKPKKKKMINFLPTIDKISPIPHDFYRHEFLLVCLSLISSAFDAPTEDILQLLSMARPQPSWSFTHDWTRWVMGHFIAIHCGLSSFHSTSRYFSRTRKHLVRKKKKKKKNHFLNLCNSGEYDEYHLIMCHKLYYWYLQAFFVRPLAFGVFFCTLS